jgi:DnaK suppressor protein
MPDPILHAGSGEGSTMKAEVFLPEDYRPAEDEPFMNERQLEYFRRKLLTWKTDLLEESRSTVETLQDGTRNIPDVADRASEETDRALELRTRDRQRKLIAKIDSALAPDRRGRIRLLRSDGGADFAQAPRRAADRDHEPRGAGTPRTAREGPSRRLRPARSRIGAPLRGRLFRFRKAPC